MQARKRPRELFFRFGSVHENFTKGDWVSPGLLLLDRNPSVRC